VNLYLEVLGKRADGYHEINTLLVAVRLYDTLVLKDDPSGRLQLRCNYPNLATGEDNLVMRAARLLQAHSGCQRGATLRLVKRIPLAAGLAGGSSDAAAALAGLNQLWHLGLTKSDLTTLAAQLGSDVPFFFHTPAAWCTGRGEQVEALKLQRPLDFVIVCPKAGLSTAEVYKHVSVPERPESGEAIRRATQEGDVEAMGRALHNRLQPAAESLCPAIAKLHTLLAEAKPAGQLMSGSGSSLFALCHHRVEAQAIARRLRQQPDQFRVFRVRSCAE